MEMKCRRHFTGVMMIWVIIFGASLCVSFYCVDEVVFRVLGNLLGASAANIVTALATPVVAIVVTAALLFMSAV